jgi:hypothetical protein
MILRERGMPNAVRGAALPCDSEPSPVDRMARAYLEEAQGDAGKALAYAIEDALALRAEMERRVRNAEQFVSRGFVRGARIRMAR